MPKLKNNCEFTLNIFFNYTNNNLKRPSTTVLD